jgi:hypothetical protein
MITGKEKLSIKGTRGISSQEPTPLPSAWVNILDIPGQQKKSVTLIKRIFNKSNNRYVFLSEIVEAKREWNDICNVLTKLSTKITN